MDLGIKGKCALITGGSHGIGLAIAHALAEEECNIAICARNPDRLDDAVEELKARHPDVKVFGCLHCMSIDVKNPDDIESLVYVLINSWGKIDILVNNVGGGGRWGSTFEDTTEDVWTEVYNKNAMAAMRFTKLVVPFMRKQKWGRVVTIASIYGKEGGGRPWFNMTKSAEISLMKSLALTPDLVRDGITFNSVAPGAISIPDTGWDEVKNPIEFRAKAESLPLGRLGTPEEVANVVAFLCSEKASLINGACVVVDGGESRSF